MNVSSKTKLEQRSIESNDYQSTSDIIPVTHKDSQHDPDTSENDIDPDDAAAIPDQPPSHRAEILLNEDGIALAFANAYRGRLLFDHQSCAWFVWNGSLWKRDETQTVFGLVRETCRRAASGTEISISLKNQIAKAAVAGAVERFAKTDRTFAVEADAWDSNPWLLGTPAGTVDLRTGLLRKAKPSDRITKSVAVVPAPTGTPHPIWTGFLKQATKNDAELQAFLQRLCGYCLTGDVTEETLAFLYGLGGSGKGTFLSAMISIMADYGVSVPIEVFTAGTRLNLEYYRALMAGARIVTASETETGATWSESQIKEMSGNEAPLSGRQPYGRVFTFRPQFKIVLVGNHAPKLKGRSKAMERRLRIIPFTHTPASPDQTLKERLTSEYPAILRWMLDGCLAWQRTRLRSAPAVDAAGSAYFETQDSFSHWIEERCTRDPTKPLEAKPSDLLADFNQWAKESNESAVTPGDFKEMVERTPGLSYTRSGGVRRVTGINLTKAQDTLEERRQHNDDRYLSD